MILFLVLFLFANPCFADNEILEIEAEAAAQAHAEAFKPRVLIVAGIGAFIEQEGHEDRYQVRAPWLLRGGWVFDRGDAYYEYSRFTVTTSEGAITIRRIQHIQLLWYRHWLEKKGNFVPYVAGALGAQANTLKTDFGSQSIKTNGENELAVGLATGAFTTFAKVYETGIEFRMLASETFRPNLAIGATLFFGIRL